MKKMLAPLAIDFGAKKTGVYYAYYEEGTNIGSIAKEGEVLEWGNYTSLLKNRTINRHIRRSYQRRKLAKRLLVLVLENYFNFSTRKHIQALGFFVNRRGFNRLEKDYDESFINKTPNEVLNLLPENSKKILTGLDNEDSLSQKIDDLSNEGRIEEIWKPIDEKIKESNDNFDYWNCLEKINDAITKKVKGTTQRRKKLNISKKVFERAIEEKIDFKEWQRENFLNFLNESDESTLKEIQGSFPEDFKEKYTESKENPWNIKLSSFDIDKNIKNEGDVKAHLEHLCFAISKIYEELRSGSRHRSKFFDEIRNDLENLSDSQYSYLVDFGQEISNSEKINNEQLFHLIAHISNFELKPLRAYFNDEKHREKDQWDLERLSKIFEKWILKQWRVGDSDGAKKKEDWGKLKTLWEKHTAKNDIVSFWSNTCPRLTIPPYQDVKNRRPPKCQTLLLNKKYLDENYPQWKDWCKQLENKDIHYGKKLGCLKSQKEKPLISADEIEIRKLQFILDASKNSDKYRLNTIWSQYKPIHGEGNSDEKKEESLRKYKEEINRSTLPAPLKNSLLCGAYKKFQKSSFGHFINKYYKTRKKARDGRYFLNQFKKDQWIDENKLLTVCSHKPRQKKHQMSLDLASILGITHDEFNEIIGKDEKKIEDWFEKDCFKGLKGHCKKAAQKQKEHKGYLKDKVDRAQESNDDELIKLKEDSKKFSKKIARKIWSQKTREEQEQYAKRFKSIFSFSQIYNIAFEDRSGFSKTCPVCSLDNSERMCQPDGKKAIASRLNRLSIRLIDGVVMRICDRLSSHIAKKIWPKIIESLSKNQKVSIPFIMEQNRFSFGPTLKDIKGKGAKKGNEEDDRKIKYSDKIKRIKKASKGICPYTGEDINSGEIDHIIPQASRHGTLNDEANLIYVSKMANAKKTDTEYSLTRLNDKYKDKVFGYKDYEKIKEDIYKNLVDENSKRDNNLRNETFIFGKYQSFIELKENQQRSFRHALFLKQKEDITLRKMVINALSNRNRAIVNGTQRYLAQCIADKIYQKAKKIDAEKYLDFDYFEYSSKANNDKSVFDLRKFYTEESSDDSELKKSEKEKGAKQEDYSHFIDAQMAFLLACEEHKNNGSMKLDFDQEEENIRQGIDEKTGEIKPLKIFDQTKIPSKDICYKTLDRAKVVSGNRHHRSYTRSSFYADHYVPLLVGEEDKKIVIKVGFSWNEDESVTFETNEKDGRPDEKSINNILKWIKFSKNKKNSELSKHGKIESLKGLYDILKQEHQNTGTYYYIHWDKRKIHEYCIEKFSNDKFSNQNFQEGKWWDDTVNFFMNIQYKTERKEVKIDQTKDIVGILGKDNKITNLKDENFKITIFKNIKQPKEKKLFIPAKKDWKKLEKDWMERKRKDSGLEKENFLKGHDIFKQDSKQQHRRIRKRFSLPIKTSEGHTLQKRNSWAGEPIYQIWSDADSRNDNNKFSNMAYNETTNESKKTINKSFRSNRQFKITEIEPCDFFSNIDQCKKIEPNKWIKIKLNERLDEFIECLEYQINDVTRPEVRITVRRLLSLDEINIIKENSLTRPKDENGKKEIDKLQEEQQPIKFKGLSFCNQKKKALSDALE